MNFKTLIYFSLALSLLASCGFFSKKEVGKESTEEIILARVSDNYLYYKDLPPYLKKYSGTDSTKAVQRFRNEWVKKQLLVQQAKDFVQEDDPSVVGRIEDYKNILLLEEYKQRYLLNKLDTSITKAEIDTFFIRNTSSLISHQDLVKGFFIKVPSNVPQLKSVKELIGKKGVEKEILSFCVRYAKDYRINSWFEKELILYETPYKHDEQNLILKTLHEKSDAEFTYLVFLSDKVAKGEPAPLGFIEGDIRTMILNKRRMKIIENLEEEIYNEGKTSGKFEIF